MGRASSRHDPAPGAYHDAGARRGAGGGAAHAERVSIEHDAASPQASYAARRLGEALREGGHEVRFTKPGAQGFVVRLAIRPERLPAEAFALTPAPQALAIEGGDGRGLVYGALAAAEALRNGTRLREIRESREAPRLELRAIKFNTPWDTYRPSSALDQHYATARDLRVLGGVSRHDGREPLQRDQPVDAAPVHLHDPAEELPRGQPVDASRSSRSGSSCTARSSAWRRSAALDTYVVHWSIFVSEAFAKAHGVAKENFYPHYYVPGDTSEIVKRYLRESVTQMLEEYPDLDGIGVSHGEGMAGMTPLERQQWIDEVLIAGMLDATRAP